ncbi:MAG: hypothetical protein ACFFG0_08320 [Candidatus Thorarchaeota archaeon]
MNKLANSRCYLGGAMEFVSDFGMEWREYLKTKLLEFNIIWLDPTNKPIDIGIEDLEGRDLRKFQKENGRFDAITHDMKIIRCVDLRMVDIADFLIVDLDVSVHTCGTYEEIFWANRCKKPVIVKIKQGKQACPDWLLGTLPHEMIFSTFEEVRDYLNHIAYDDIVTINHMKRWMFFNWMGE